MRSGISFRTLLGCSAFAITMIAGGPLFAQSFQPRNAKSTPSQQSRPVNSEAVAESSSAVSEDLLQLYALTKTAKTELEVTTIARSCSKIIPAENRSQVDRDYAASLLSWSLNRRGEMRSEQAATLVQQGKLAEASKIDKFAADDFATAVEYGPGNWRTRHNYAIALAMKSEYDQAIEQFGKAIELKSDYPNAFFNRAELYFELQDYDAAVQDYTSAVALNSSDPQYYNSRAHAHFMLEAYDEALADYVRATEFGPDSAVYFTDLADTYQYLGYWEEAAQEYRSALKLNNKLARAYQNAAWLMATCPVSKIRNGELALTAAKKAIELSNGETPQLLDVLAAATATIGRYQEAVQLQTKALSMSRDEAERAELQQRLKLYQRKQAYVQSEKSESGATITASTSAPSNR